jgi:hypothetical protein
VRQQLLEGPSSFWHGLGTRTYAAAAHHHPHHYPPRRAMLYVPGDQAGCCLRLTQETVLKAVITGHFMPAADTSALTHLGTAWQWLMRAEMLCSHQIHNLYVCLQALLSAS